MAEQAIDDAAAVVRLIDAGRVSPLQAQAMYHGVADAMAPGDAPVVVLADPDSSFVSAGAYQDVAREIDLQSCVNTNTPVIRRATGGPAVMLTANDTMIHFVLPRGRTEAAGSAGGLYARFAEPLIRTWRAFGLPVEHGAWGGISLDRYRIGGVQAGVIGAVAVVGGSILQNVDADTIVQRASLPSDEVRDQLRQTIRERLSRATNRPPDRDSVRESLLGHVSGTLGWTLRPAALRDDEVAAIDQRAAQMADTSHVYSGGRRMALAELRAGRGLALVDLVHRGSGGMVRLRLLERAGVIEDIEITGELTSMPHDGLGKLEPRLVGLRRDAPDLATRIQVEMGLLGVELPGVTATELASALRPIVRPPGPDPLDLLFGNAAEQ
ncbi:MAG: lipoate--protein ligase family protein [Alphaproteobacteria bacterium]|nr:lipoate--protein ligase family protein [Alphaproteobacteria bacterium]